MAWMKKQKQDEQTQPEFPPVYEQPVAPVKEQQRTQYQPQMPPQYTPAPKGSRTRELPEKTIAPNIPTQADGLFDTETNEVLARTVWEALAEIVERLKRIEDKLN